MKISIITINYNNKEGLKKTISSVIKQSFKDYEYFIVDGGSTDGSVEVIMEASKGITHWISEKDTGIYNAMNKGLAFANGAYCFFLNSGDYLANESILEDVYPHLNEDIVYGDLYFEYPGGTTETAIFEDNMSLFKLSYTGIPHQGTFIKRSLLNKLGGYKEEFKIVADWFFFVEAIIKYNVSFTKLNFVISYFDKSGVSSTTDSGEERSNALRKFYPFLLNEFKVYNELRNYKLSRVHQTLRKILYLLKAKRRYS